MRSTYVQFVAGRVARSLRELFWTHLLTAGIMAMTLSVFGGFLIIQDNVGRLVKGWGEEIQVFVYLEDGVDAAAAETMRAAVVAYPEVRVAELRLQERRLGRAKNPGCVGDFSRLESQVLPDPWPGVALRLSIA